MKVSTSLALALAPLALARRVHNVYPPRAEPELDTEADIEDIEDRSVKIIHDMAGVTVNSQTEIIIIWANPGNGAATTTVNAPVTVTSTVTVAPGQVETSVAPPGASHTVTVGGPGGLIFQPDQLNNVPVGDTVVFEFLSMNHTVTQAGFKEPCKALEGGMDSGFQANPNNTVSPPPQVAMQVMATTPLWFYCRQKGHCGKGMVFSINPTADKTQAMFQAMAIAQNGKGESTPITGGSGGAPPAAAPAEPAQSAPPAAAPAAGDGATPGTGTIGSDGSCHCTVQCVPGSFPANVQGIGSFGGYPGSLPMTVGAMDPASPSSSSAAPSAPAPTQSSAPEQQPTSSQPEPTAAAPPPADSNEQPKGGSDG